MAIFLIDKDRRILLSNRLAGRCYGLDRNGSQTKQIGDVIGCTNASHSADGCGRSASCQYCPAKAMIDQAFAGKCSGDPFETQIRNRSMGLRSLRITVSHIHSTAMLTSRKEICVVTVEDLTEIKKKEKMAAAGETIGAVCHELNQPLQAIMGSCALLAAFPLDHRAMARLEQISSEIERIKSITTKMMNITDYQTKPYLSKKILDIDQSASI